MSPSPEGERNGAAIGGPAVELAPGVRAGGEKLALIAGPCALESEELALEVARTLRRLADQLPIEVIFKGSFDKANRSSVRSYRGPGLEDGLATLAAVKRETGLPVLTDVHEPEQCAPVAEVCDALQIPAFLCRQTDLITAAAATGRAVNVKKGQFVAPEDMARAAEKARQAGNHRVTITERGYSFGYNNLVVDMRSFPMMQAQGLTVIYDATHSLQLPGAGETTGGARQYAEPLARAAVAAGADGIFLEIHPDPERALSDATTQLDPDRAAALIGQLADLYRWVRRPGSRPSGETR